MSNTAMPSPTAFRPDSTGTLKTTITLGKSGPSVLQSGPFYLIRAEPPEESELTGSVNLLEYYGLDNSYYKMSTAKKLKEELSSFLPNLPGFLDIPASEDGSSLKELYANPPRVRKEIEPLNPQQLLAFRLKPGQLPERFRLMDISAMKKQHKRKRRKDEASSDQEASPEAKRMRKEKDEERRSKKKDKKRKRKDEHQNGD